MQAKCPSCDKLFAFKEEALGKRAKCSGCQTIFTLLDDAVAPVPVIPLSSIGDSSKSQSKPSKQNGTQKPIQSDVIKVARPAAKASIKPLTIEQRRKAIMDGFQGVFQRPQSTTTYRLGLFFSAFIAMLLPLIYLAFIGLIVWLVYLHLRYNISIFEVEATRGKQVIGMIIIYVAPLVAGAIAIVFMVKPILAPSSRNPSRRSVTPEEEPILFEFVKRICEDVRAPIPKRIDIDAEVNASASFRNGWWSLFRSNDLVLTLGMPLVAGMSTRQLAGVIAHEFGHFSQGAGMRLTYVLRTTNLWFLRVVYERDEWDDWLEQMYADNDRTFALVFYLAKAAVWVSRKVLWCLFQLGNLLTGFVQQQMEFDADKYEIAMAGRTTFQSSFRALRLLSVGFGQSANALQRTIQENRFVDNIPKFVVAQAKRIPGEVQKEIDESVTKEETGLFDSHPCDRERIAAAANAPDEGRYTAILPAATLFVGFEQACRLVTRDFYVDTLEIPIEHATWVSTDSIVAEESVEDEAWKAIRNLGEECIHPRRSLVLPAYHFEPSGNPKLSAEVFSRSKVLINSHRDHYRQFMSLEETRKELAEKKNWIEELKPHVNSVDRSILKGLASTSGASSDNKKSVREANLYLRAVAAKIYQAGRLLHHQKVAENIDDGSGWLVRVERVSQVLFVMEPLLDQIQIIEERLGYFAYVIGHLESNQENRASILNQIETSIRLMYENLQHCYSILVNVPYPYVHAEEDKSTGDVLLPLLPLTDDLFDTAQKAAAFTEGFLQLRGRCIGTLALMAEKVEQVLEEAAI